MLSDAVPSSPPSASCCRFQEHMSKVNMVFKPVLGTQWEDPRGWVGGVGECST